MLGTGRRFIVIGFGNMGKAIAAGLLKAGLVTPDSVVAVDPSEHAESGCSALGLRRQPDLSSVGPLQSGDVVLLAVKPQMFASVSEALAVQLSSVSDRGGVLVLSIMAGVTSQRIAGLLGPSAGVVRAMPNTPAQIGQGATAFTLGSGASEVHQQQAETILRAIGPLVVRIDESLMDAFTAVAGSGPAYLFHLAESMTAGAIAAGFDRSTADAIVRQTLLGAATLLSSDTATPLELRKRVTSKGGTTEAALDRLNQAGVHSAMVNAIIAARDRGRELGRAAQ